MKVSCVLKVTADLLLLTLPLTAFIGTLSFSGLFYLFILILLPLIPPSASVGPAVLTRAWTSNSLEQRNKAPFFHI